MVAVLMGLGVSYLSAVAQARPETIYFPFNDQEYLNSSQHNGGAALLPEQDNREQLPLIVFLHGTNPNGELHLWLGGGGHDLRPVAARLYRDKQLQPFVLAGPSQTRTAAHGQRMWKHFDLDGFVDGVARALDGRASIDRDAVIFVGHSGAGCNEHGGIASDFWTTGHVTPQALVAIDPCMDAGMGAALSRRPAGVPLWLMWQSVIWPRHPSAFKHALAAQRPASRVDRIEELTVLGSNPHDAIVPRALERVARALFERATPDGSTQSSS